MPSPAYARLRRLLGRSGAAGGDADYVDDETLRVLGGSLDAAASDGAVLAALAAEGVELERALLVRHRLVLPDQAAVLAVLEIVGQEGYAVRATPRPDGGWDTRVSRTETPSGMVLSRERTRMAGLAQRHGGDALGWELCGR